MNITKIAYVHAEGLDDNDLQLVQNFMMNEEIGDSVWTTSETTDIFLTIEFNADTASFLEAADIISNSDVWKLVDEGVVSIELYTQ